MKTHLDHVEIRIKPANVAFYSDLMAFLGWNILHQDETVLGLGSGDAASLWFTTHASDAGNDYDGPGVNHLGISASSQAEVDATVDYLKSKNLPALFETPRHRPEFATAPTETYYQVMFESPDKVRFEVVYTGPKQ